MPDPEMVERGGRDQVLPRRFLAQNIGKARQHCFTWNALALTQPAPRFVLGHAARRRAWRRIADSAAGVRRRMRDAAPSVSGRAAISRSTISFDRPGMAAKSRSALSRNAAVAPARRTSRFWRAPH